MNRNRIASAALVAAALAGCSSPQSSVDAPIERRPTTVTGRNYTLWGKTIALHDLEQVPDNEVEEILKINEFFESYFAREYGAPEGQRDSGSGLLITGTRRGVHPKAHGCVAGTLRVRSDLEDRDKVGIFRPGAEYRVTVRFSNASPRANVADKENDSRGIGIKVHGVDGPQVLGDPASTPGGDSSQDFTMNSTDAFVANSAENYRHFMDTVLFRTTNSDDAAESFISNLVMRGHPVIATRAFRNFLKIASVRATNPLALRYWSITAFQHGRGPRAPIVKYSVVPCTDAWTDQVDEADPNYLRANLTRRIGEREACFNFLVQDRASDKLSVEDPMLAWKEQDAPFRHLATLVLPRQRLLDERVCEGVVINPWNSLEDHKPVGAINRLRLANYLVSIERRKRTNR